jgi:hypothetical protein
MHLALNWHVLSTVASSGNLPETPKALRIKDHYFSWCLQKYDD